MYLKLVRYHDHIIVICENRISELLDLLDKTSIDKLYNDINLKQEKIINDIFNEMSNQENANSTIFNIYT